MQYDIAIVGGGMVGAAFACALANTSLKIALIDATPENPPDDQRLIALNYNSYCFFKNIHLWPFLSDHASAIHTIHVSHQGHFGKTEMHAHELGLPCLGYVVPAKFITSALTQQLSAIKTLKIYRPAVLTEITQDTSQVTLTFNTHNSSETIQASIVIAADGTHSTVRRLLGMECETIDYQQKALVLKTHLQREHKNIAYERFLKIGAIAMLPLVGNSVATIWTGEDKYITELLNMRDDDFLNLLQKQFGYRLGRLMSIGKRFVYPLKFIKVSNQISGRTVLVGNAAHTLHPIAAQGLNLALFEIAELVEHFSKELSLPARLSEEQQRITMGLSHRLSWLFSVDFLPFKVSRQLGMLGLDLCGIAKQRFAARAMSLGMRPNLLRDIPDASA